MIGLPDRYKCNHVVTQSSNHAIVITHQCTIPSSVLNQMLKDVNRRYLPEPPDRAWCSAYEDAKREKGNEHRWVLSRGVLGQYSFFLPHFSPPHRFPRQGSLSVLPSGNFPRCRA